tara:strand:- start:198 stop:428 length:231 start_codon:yes stop_codon:yes gene_type:complete
VKKFFKKLDYKLMILLIIIFIGIVLSVCLPRIEYSDKIVIEIDKKTCSVSLLDKDKLIAKLKSNILDCKVYILKHD